MAAALLTEWRRFISTPMNIGNIKAQYLEYIKDVKAFPSGSDAKRRAKRKLSDYLTSVRERFGQDVVDEICNVKKKTPS